MKSAQRLNSVLSCATEVAAGWRFVVPIQGYWYLFLYDMNAGLPCGISLINVFPYRRLGAIYSPITPPYHAHHIHILIPDQDGGDTRNQTQPDISLWCWFRRYHDEGSNDSDAQMCNNYAESTIYLNPEVVSLQVVLTSQKEIRDWGAVSSTE